MIGAGVVINPKVLLDEIERFMVKDVLIDSQCGIIEDDHLNRDRGSHLGQKIGTTGTGTGPANADRVMRTAKIAVQVPELGKYLGDVAARVNEAAKSGKGVLVEGTQGTFLSLYHGTYPYVTSKDITASGICADVGIGPKMVDEVLLVLKSYVTRVGSGPLAGELSAEEAASRGWLEVATVTGRTRRSAPFDFDLARRAAMLNSATSIALTKLDIVFHGVKGATKFSHLPQEAIDFINSVEEKMSLPVSIIGTGPELGEVIDRRKQ
jgi:adenylosuccinate synthase